MPGEGAAELTACLRLLVAAGYRGAWSIEPHLQVLPHRGWAGSGAERLRTFLDYGRRLERLVAEQVLAGE
jgi:sugar phosphate isomerase/epimerase